jgi:hypothetical protein
MELSRHGIASRMRDASDREVALRFVALHYGEGLASEVEADLAKRVG